MFSFPKSYKNENGNDILHSDTDGSDSHNTDNDDVYDSFIAVTDNDKNGMYYRTIIMITVLAKMMGQCV